MGGWGDREMGGHGDPEKNLILLRIPESAFLHVLFLLPHYSSIPTFHYSRGIDGSKS